MQSKLDKFFNIKIKHNTNSKKCFIYDPDNYKAFFDYSPLDSDTFITTKTNLKLYYRTSNKPNTSIVIPQISPESTFVPLLKSNLQKAVRRCETSIALSSTLAIIQLNPIELLRRLPIIIIEDVTLLDSMPIIIWLMIADKEYILKPHDIHILLNIIWNLCNIQDYFYYHENDTKREFTHETLENHTNSNELLALYYRSLYGGMPGDIQLVNNATDYYSNFPNKIHKTTFNNFQLERFIINTHIIPEAVDFHCYPQMITSIHNKTHIPYAKIKEYIWNCLSGYNTRKPFTINSSEKYTAEPLWKTINPILKELRIELISGSIH